ncbi:hypothetical protein FRC06_009363 [Ceratobasidium sp. 370]|nr:hypothetical protein FRC06_009363 [Ceratobasidium sp. 370]
MGTVSTKTPAERAKAREEIKVTKRVPREFALFLPQSLCSADGITSKPDARPSPKPLTQPPAPESQRTLRTRHVKLIAAQLEVALKKRARETRAADRQKSRAQAAVSQAAGAGMPTTPVGLGTRKIPRLVVEVPTPPTQTPKPGLMDIGDSSERRVAAEGLELSAPGLSEVSAALPISRTPSRPELNMLSSAAPQNGQQAWWLDVASPTWEDMRVLGKLLHLHPLTLEDILHEDPREKLELFPRLGYYFVVFRALETQAALKRPLPPDAEQEGTIGAVNVYFVVFREGIVTFHFEDIAEHADRVRQKIVEFEQTIQMSSDWISHGLMDSMVDAFAPILRKIDKEVEGVDSLITNMKTQLEPAPPSEITVIGGSSDAIEQKVVELEKREKTSPVPSRVDFKLRLPLRLRVWKSRIRSWVRSMLPKSLHGSSKEKITIPEPPTKLATFQTLLRMANTRRLVTSLGRLLATKSEVIGQLRKRLQGTNGNAVDWDEGDMAGGQEVGIYLGDVQDHILTMQQALNHYERILSHDHPAYLAHLRVLLSEAKGGKDKMILSLSIVIFTVPAMQWPIGLGSMNVHIPNQKGTPYYTYWAIWVASTAVAMVAVIGMVRWWWVRAKRRRKRNNKLA